eukprot:7487071-Pyramimonas_sp.AAC.1
MPPRPGRSSPPQSSARKCHASALVHREPVVSNGPMQKMELIARARVVFSFARIAKPSAPEKIKAHGFATKLYNKKACAR